MTAYDLVVVGTGTGLDVANWGASQGWRVALVEKGDAGGTCLNRGCIPSKMLIHCADVARSLRDAPRLHLHPRGLDVDFPRLVARVRDHVDGASRRIAEALRSTDDLHYLEGEARFVGPRRLRVGGEELEAERIVLATGARPRIPVLEGLADVPFFTSTEALKPERLPERLVILGGGYIAAELGHFYGSLGSHVTVVHKHARMLPKEDRDVSAAFTRAFARDHEVLLGSMATRVRRDGDEVEVTVASEGGQARTLRADALLVAIGITPNSDTLDLEKGGVEVDKRGYIRADLALRTTAPGVWALGDAIGRFPFKHAANHEARTLIANLAQPHARQVDYHAMPHAVFSHPQVAGVGCTQQELEEAGVPFAAASHAYADTAMGKALAEEDGFVKFLVSDDEERRILGCHIMGPDASTLLHEVLVAMRVGNNSLHDLAETVHIHPALNEVVQRAAW